MGILDGSPRYPASVRRMLWENGLASNIVDPVGVYPRPAMRVAPFYEQFGIQFVWDLPYSTYAVARVTGDVALCQGFVENMLEFQLGDGPDAGMVMRSVTAAGDQAGQDGTQVPLLCWVSRELWRMGGDAGFVARVYPRLAAFIDWWQSPRRDFDGDGLSEYGGTTPTYVAYESGHDYSPERDLVMGEPTAASADGLVHEPIADVFLNSCLYVELVALAEFAGVVGDGARAGEWAARRDALAARMREAMWCDEVGGYFPVVRRDLCPSQPRFYRHTPALLQPLWAGLATQEEAERTVATLKTQPRDYPYSRGVMTIRLGDDLYHGSQVVTDGLHPSRGTGAGAGGVEVSDRRDGLVARFGDDRGPATTAFLRVFVAVEVESVSANGDSSVVVEVEDGTGYVHRPLSKRVDEPGVFEGQLGGSPWESPGRRSWTLGLRRIEVTAPGCVIRSVKVTYFDMFQRGLLSRFGIKSAHPLDGKHPAPGAPTEFWSGTLWGPHQFHGCYGLERYGFSDLASVLARAWCDAMAASVASGGDAYEHLDWEDAQGLGVANYTWGAATALVLMEDLAER